MTSPSSQPISSLSQFLCQSGVETRFYDLGRRISKIGSTDFEAFEMGQIAYPAPYLQQAWLGLVFWVPHQEQAATVWFLRFPLDEQGKLQLPERDRFLQMLVTAVGANLQAARAGENLQAVLEGNPFVFTPPPERQAAFHARIKLTLRQPPSQYYQPVQNYLTAGVMDPQARESWQDLGLQGFADVAVRWQKKDTYGPLLKALPLLPAPVLTSLCECLENEAVDAKVATALVQRLEPLFNGQGNTADDETSKLVAATVRALSNSIATGMRQQLLSRLIGSELAQAPEVMVAIATRCGDDLLEPSLTLPFLELLARYPQQTFNRVMADLLFQPHLRTALLTAFRNPERSEPLSRAIGALLQPKQQ